MQVLAYGLEGEGGMGWGGVGWGGYICMYHLNDNFEIIDEVTKLMKSL